MPRNPVRVVGDLVVATAAATTTVLVWTQWGHVLGGSQGGLALVPLGLTLATALLFLPGLARYGAALFLVTTVVPLVWLMLAARDSYVMDLVRQQRIDLDTLPWLIGLTTVSMLAVLCWHLATGIRWRWDPRAATAATIVVLIVPMNAMQDDYPFGWQRVVLLVLEAALFGTAPLLRPAADRVGPVLLALVGFTPLLLLRPHQLLCEWISGPWSWDDPRNYGHCWGVGVSATGREGLISAAVIIAVMAAGIVPGLRAAWRARGWRLRPHSPAFVAVVAILAAALVWVLPLFGPDTPDAPGGAWLEPWFAILAVAATACVPFALRPERPDAAWPIFGALGYALLAGPLLTDLRSNPTIPQVVASALLAAAMLVTGRSLLSSQRLRSEHLPSGLTAYLGTVSVVIIGLGPLMFPENAHTTYLALGPALAAEGPPPGLTTHLLSTLLGAALVIILPLFAAPQQRHRLAAPAAFGTLLLAEPLLALRGHPYPSDLLWLTYLRAAALAIGLLALLNDSQAQPHHAQAHPNRRYPPHEDHQ